MSMCAKFVAYITKCNIFALICSANFFLTEMFRFPKAGKSKQSSLTHNLVSSLVYKIIYWQRWVGKRRLWTPKMRQQLPGGFIWSNCGNTFLKVFTEFREYHKLYFILFCYFIWLILNNLTFKLKDNSWFSIFNV